MVFGEILLEIINLFTEMAPYLLLGLFFAGILYVFFSKDFVMRHLGRNNFWAIIKAAFLGVPLPLCSCGVVPTAVALHKNGASKGATLSFLISTPQTGIDSIIATYGLMGWAFAIYRPFVSFFMGLFGGTAVQFAAKKPNSGQIQSNEDMSLEESQNLSWSQKLKKLFHYAFVRFLDDIAWQLVIGIIIAGLISFFIPANFFDKIGSGLPGMLLMLVAGIPMYICATASIPIALSLMAKGISPGAAFVFLAAGPATNAASLTVLLRVLGRKAIAIYLSVIAFSAVGFGLLFDFLIKITGIKIKTKQHMSAHGEMFYLEIISGIALALLLIASLFRKFILPRFKRLNTVSKQFQLEPDQTKFTIEGMTCKHCVENVKQAITNTDGVENVWIDLESGQAIIQGNFSQKELAQKISDIGYKLKL